MEKIKICTKCKKELPVNNEYFANHKITKDGFRSACKECYNKEAKIYNEKNKEKIKEKMKEKNKLKPKKIKQNITENKKEYIKQYYQKNKKAISERQKLYRKNNHEQIKEREKRYKEKNKEQIKKYLIIYNQQNKERIYEFNKEYFNKNKEKYKIYSKQYREKHKEELKKYQLAYVQKNKEKLKKKSSIYAQNNKEKLNLLWQKRNALKKQLEATLTVEQWEQIKKDFDYKCCYCGRELQLHQEHFLALSKFGEYTHNNIIPACKSCNSSKNNRDFFIWYPQYRYYSKKREQKILQYLNYTNKGTQQLTLAL